MRSNGWLFLAATAVPLVGVGLMFTAFDRPDPHDFADIRPLAAQIAPGAAIDATRNAPVASETAQRVRVVNPYNLALADSDAAPAGKDDVSRLVMPAGTTTLTAELGDGMAVVVRERGDEGEILMTVDPTRRVTEIAMRSDLPRVSVDPATAGEGYRVSASVDREAARDIVLEAIESRSEVAKAVFFRSDIEADPVSGTVKQ